MSLEESARRLAKSLAHQRRRVVFAESCTGGLASAALTQVPGVSEFHCGGVVTYRNTTKTAYLQIDPAILAEHDAVSEIVAQLMAKQVLEKTPEADFAVSTTGHLGPNAPPGRDGIVFLGLAERSNPIVVRQVQLPLGCDRVQRQRLAAQAALDLLAERLDKTS